jgi:hypothetical protein
MKKRVAVRLDLGVYDGLIGVWWVRPTIGIDEIDQNTVGLVNVGE